MQTWTLTCDKQFEEGCRNNGIELTSVKDVAALQKKFDDNPIFCRNGRTSKECVDVVATRGRRLEEIAAYVREPKSPLGNACFCGCVTTVDEPAFVGKVADIFRFLSYPDVQNDLGVISVDAKAATVTFKSTDNSGKEGKPQSFRFSTVSNQQNLIVYKRIGRMQFTCV